jgi:hypothetical protein
VDTGCVNTMLQEKLIKNLNHREEGVGIKYFGI